MLIETADGLFCPAGSFHVDPWNAVPRALVTHAHADHARPGSAAYLCATPAGPLLRRRFGAEAAIETIAYGRPIALGDVTVSFHPAGHVLGSAQIRLEPRTGAAGRGVWVIGGDYKRAPDPSCAPFEAVPCDTFVTEATFGLPIYRWDDTASIVGDIVHWWDANAAERKSSVLFCYAIGKAQRILAELARVSDRRVYVHGMMLPMIEAYREQGVHMAEVASATDQPRGTSFAGELVLAPLLARGTPWMRRLGSHSDAFASGLMRVRGVRRQRAFDRGFVLSDHADWPALLQTIADTGAAHVLATHGHAEPLARYLSERGHRAGVIRTAWEGEGAGD
jgi:putative mRNA 3-end processing factor